MRLKKRILCLLLISLFMTVASGCGGVSETEDTADLSEKIIGTEGQENASDNIGESDITSETEAIPSDEESEEKESEEKESEEKESEDEEENTMVITVNGSELTAVMEDNSSATGLMKLLADGSLTIEMSDYANMEKVGSIGTNLPRNDKQITTGAGDLILYQGNSFVI